MSDIPPTANQTTFDNPWSVSYYSRKFAMHVANAPTAWIEGEVVSIKKYPHGAYLKVKDLNSEAFLPASTFLDEILQDLEKIKEGAHVVFRAQPQFWVKRGELTMSMMHIREVGVGDILQKIEELKKKLQSEGLFDSQHKKKLPFLPATIGLICGRNAQAKDDVLQNVRRRWPSARFTIREVSVGNSSATPKEVSSAVEELDNVSEVEVIVIARGGGALEEVVFPFSNEELIRTVYSAQTPIVSAIGHESDVPLLDFVVDFRASTPTDAARTIVPSIQDEQDLVKQAQMQLYFKISNQLENEKQILDNMISRPVLKNISTIFEPQLRTIEQEKTRLLYNYRSRIEREIGSFSSVYTHLQALNPKSTLKRGYAIVQQRGKVVSKVAQLKCDDNILVQFSDGEVSARVENTKVEVSKKKKSEESGSEK
ncbi:MAG: exodeoxyribonuclease VII large subunit [Candidatus Ancillula trichonymphae]|jgi:exodeoxyribonuclease VII large subunit|nr:exodeoxyribonuclease VII large subunit [Candidatus Ancillula trichonymphae]